MRSAHPALLAALALSAAPAGAFAASLAQGDRVANVVRVSSAEVPTPIESPAATVTAVTPVPARLELLGYAPLLAGSTPEPVVQGAWRTGPADADPFTVQAPPRLAGASAPIDLSAPLGLAPAAQVHQGDAIFVRLTDLDQNLDRTSRETVVVTLTDDATGDVETVRLTEDGPDTGVFVGYLQTASAGGGSPAARDGVLAVDDGSRVTASYVDADDATDVVSTAVAVDPFGIVFDGQTGQPVNGASLTVLDTATGQPAEVLGDDGVSTFPSTVTSGGTAQDSSGRVYRFGPGGYRFPFLRRGGYRYAIVPPAGYRAPSLVPTATLQALPGAPFAIVEPGSRGEAFTLDPGPALRIDVPLDPATGSLVVQKIAGKVRVAMGDFLPYEVDVTNRDAATAAPGVRVVDVLPVGFRYRRGSTQLGGVTAADPTVSADGRTLTFDLGALAPSQAVSIRYVAVVGAGARLDAEAVNVARATASSGAASNEARASVLVADELLADRSFLLGRVTTGACAERDGADDRGVPSIRVVLEDGTWVMTDRRGLYHFEGLAPGSHVVQLDLDSVPAEYEVVPCAVHDRFAGRSFSQFVDLQGGTAWRADFHLAARPRPPPPPPPPPPEIPIGIVSAAAAPPAPAAPPQVAGRIAIQLRQRVEGTVATFEVQARGAAAAGDLRIELALPEGLVYEAASSAADGAPIGDPGVEGAKLRYALGAVGPEWSKVLTLRARLSPEAAAGPRTVEAVALVAGATSASSPASRASLLVVREAESVRVTLHPRFATLSDQLETADLLELQRTARSLEKARPERLVVIGYTDSQRISGAGRKRFADNQALSLARARTVGRVLSEALHLTPEQVVSEGRGEAEPVASNATPAGRAQNRRVEVSLLASSQEAPAALRALDDGPEVEIATAPAEASTPAPDSAIAPAPAAQAGAAVAPPPALEPVAQAAAATSPAVAEADPSGPAAAPTPDGFVSPKPGELVADRVVAVQARLPSALAVRLEVDGKQIPASRIGYKREDPKTGKTDYTFVGVNLGDPGTRRLVLTGRDPFGNERFREEVSVTRVGEIASIRFVGADDNVADGKTPIRLRFEVRDASGELVRGATRLQIKEGALQGYRRGAESDPDPDAARRPYVDKDGWALFQPVGTAGPYRAVVACGGASVEVETWVKPRMRDWILVGLAEGTVGHDVVRGNMKSLEAADASADDLWKGGRVAFYAKGQVQGKWLVTAAMDTRGSQPAGRSSLFQAIDPNQYYTVYGDASQQAYDAPSARHLYLRLEREQFYALFGDYDTGLTVTELSRYSRRLNGVKAELQTRNVEATGFAARTDKVYVRDEVPGDGTSGLYRLSRRALTLNSEIVTLVARDRFHPEREVSSRPMVRFVDYSIDYDAGTLFFSQPIQSRDDALNPIVIVVEYENSALASEDYTAGGRVGLKLLDQRLRAGVTVVHQGQGQRKNDLLGVDTRIDLTKDTRARAEFAVTDSQVAGASATGTAWLAELQHTGRRFDARLYLREQQSSFGLGQQPRPDAGTRKLGLDLAIRFDDRLGLTAQAFRQEIFATGATRTAADTRATWHLGRASAYAGLLDATDTLGDGSSHHSGQVTAGGKFTPAERLTLGLDWAQLAWGDGNADFPTRVAGRAEYKLTDAVTLVSVEELTWGSTATTQNTRVGLQSTPWKGASALASVERQLNESAERVLGNVGLRQTWQLTPEWKLDAGGEHAQTLERRGFYQLQPGVAPASGATVEDFTALGTGAAYQRQGFVAEGRAELRTSSSEDKWVLQSGAVAELSSGWAISGRAQLLTTQGLEGHSAVGDLRLGLAFRPPRTRWIFLQRLDYVLERRASTGPTAAVPTGTGALGDTDSWRLVENLVANYRPRKDAQVSVGVGMRFLRERISGELEQGFSDQLSGEVRLDLSPRLDVGARASVRQTWATGAVAWSAGPSIGYSPVTNAWVSFGFNVLGYQDRDFSASDYTAYGPFIKVRFKFDQQSIVGLGQWINRQ